MCLNNYFPWTSWTNNFLAIFLNSSQLPETHHFSRLARCQRPLPPRVDFQLARRPRDCSKAARTRRTLSLLSRSRTPYTGWAGITRRVQCHSGPLRSGISGQWSACCCYRESLREDTDTASRVTLARSVRLVQWFDISYYRGNQKKLVLLMKWTRKRCRSFWKLPTVAILKMEWLPQLFYWQK